MSKIIVINKPLGMTSNDVVQKVKQICNFKKVGHAGTLDPNASGVLIIGYNEGTKLLGSLTLDKKEYIATIKFGEQTSTYDCEGEIFNKSDNKITLEQIIKTLEQLSQAPFMQKPPIYSAIKINGRKLYDYARQGIKVDIPEREVKIYEYEILNFDYQLQTLILRCLVSKGFYIRSLSNDLGEINNTYAYLKDLIRTKSGSYTIEQSIKLESLKKENYESN